jgi:hypothetical protein
MKSALICIAALCAPLRVAAATQALPLEPISAIVGAFQSHDIVALGDGNHGNVQISDLRFALVRNPELQSRVRDIVVE